MYANKHTLVICRKTADFSRKYQRSIVCCIVLVILDTCDSWLISLHHSCIHLDTPSRKSDVLKIQHSTSGLPPGFQPTSELQNAERPAIAPPTTIHYSEKHVSLPKSTTGMYYKIYSSKALLHILL